MASALGRTARRIGRGGAVGLEGDRDGRPWTVRGLALSSHPEAGMAPDAASE